jgi:hypothetical protein
MEDIGKGLEEAYKGQVVRLFDGFFNNVLIAKDKESELAAGGEKLRASIDLLNRTLARAREVTA